MLLISRAIPLIFILSMLAASCKTRSDNGNGKVPIPGERMAINTSEQNVSIHQAALNGETGVVLGLLANGVSVDTVDVEKRTPLMYAAYNGHTELIKKLLEKGAEVNLRDIYGRTSLMLASSGPFLPSVKLLLDNYADPNITDTEEHFSALMYAASEGQLEIVKLLLVFKADPFLKDIDGDDAMSFAQKNGHVEVAQLLQSLKK